MNLLLLEDDKVLANEIVKYLEFKGFKCNHTFNGPDFLDSLTNNNYDFYLLDINVPDINGLEICKKIRKKNQITPIIMITANGEIQQKIKSFNLGADDYLVKPFYLDELYIRIKSISKRIKEKENSKYIQFENLEIHLEDKIVKRAGSIINLTKKEFSLLVILASNKDTIISKKEIAIQLWDDHFETSFNTIEVYINFLRRKIDKNFPENEWLIHTKMGFGYYIGLKKES